MPSAQAKSDLERATRLRENKRKHRSRQKEYVADLERKLDEYRLQGIQATKEVQLSARRVAQENISLRLLLRQQGVDDVTVDAWVQKALDNHGSTSVCAEPEWGEASLVTPSTSTHISPLTNTLDATRIDTDPSSCQVSPAPLIVKGPDATGKEPLDWSPASTRCDTSNNNQRTPAEEASIDQAASAIPYAPCKLLTQLKANPGADITQLPVEVARGEEAQDESDGVECNRAYQMLMRFATTEEKLDTVAHALEKGCVKNGGGKGGCRVRNEAIMKALDSVIS
ncbi:hypothetical protein H2199_003077 [Coniosporium tulheliwenetii]|uniref:Uncharacterized protein n=1 Tax=Coniosporium tulheliwenetii TaxID=3383036 RepID=A0ACC2ZBG6_9PEZI|nr:hypothetical protein H2199_003077 [Cladosporium sp. JES 115]